MRRYRGEHKVAIANNWYTLSELREADGGPGKQLQIMLKIRGILRQYNGCNSFHEELKIMARRKNPPLAPVENLDT